MTKRFACGLAMLLGFAVCGTAEEKKAEKAAASNDAGLEKLKKLAGEWVAADKDGKPTALQNAKIVGGM